MARRKPLAYDLIIVGAGPAGLTAAIYAARYKLSCLVIAETIGGRAAEAFEIKNFPSYEKISGIELMEKIRKQTECLGVEIKNERVDKIKKEKGYFVVKTTEKDYLAKKIILANGLEKKRLGLEKEDKFLGKGVSYCAVCDAPFFKNKKVAVVGGSDSALAAASLLSRFANKVYIIYRKEKFFRAKPAMVEEVRKNKKIKAIFNVTVTKLLGEERLKAIELSNKKRIAVDGLFVEIGASPNVELAKDLGIELENGYIKVDEMQRTNVKGVYAAGDITNRPLKQIITAAAQGAVAATTVYEELKEK
ncbi:MAG TPA: FAD-binding protein [Candidatus Pacearchaeota archaeon]|nr:FAD-binding protein [Candidatus Pacearchaeota archaeon]